MKKIKKTLSSYFTQKLTSLWLALFLIPGITFAQDTFFDRDVLDNLNGVATGPGHFWTRLTGDPVETALGGLGGFVSILLSLLGVFFLILIIYAGFRWMFARGNEEEVQKAQKIILSSLQGLLIVVTAFALTKFIGFVIERFDLL